MSEDSQAELEGSRRFHIRTYGCQMNVHDSQKIANLLAHAGFAASDDGEAADLLVVNTCSIREKAENRLYTDLGLLREWKARRPGRLLGVAGCVAQQEGDEILRRFAEVDFVCGTHNLRLVPALVAAAERGRRSLRTDEDPTRARFELPERHPGLSNPTPGRAFVTVMEGCDMFCSFCIVPTTRGREVSRSADSILEEVRGLADAGVVEVTLLGQTVNAYGRHDLRRGRADAEGTTSFAALLAALDAVPGIERIRYTSPHPIFFDEALVEAHAALPSLCPHVHLPVQSGSDAVLAAMRRRYTADAVRELVGRLRAARPDLALTTDLIVGFPGETDADFRATLELVRDADFVDSYSFKYSPRPGTAAAERSDRVPPELAQERLEALQEQQRGQTLAAHRARVGGRAEVLVEGTSRRGDQLSGRDPQHRLFNLTAPAESGPRPAAEPGPRPGDRVWVRAVEATPRSLIGEIEAPRLQRSLRRADEQGHHVRL